MGCVLVDANYHVLATGYNGTPAGAPHCTDTPCAGAGFPSGQGLERCEAIHAEQNALLQCADVRRISLAYVTAFPCVHCVKLLLNTGCQSVIYGENYSHSEAVEMWERSGRRRLSVPRG